MMIFVMVVLGGLTRLTESGLSMVNWRPITGWLPPLTLDEWQAAFDLYKGSPQYHKINHGMTLEEFQGIFWLEFIHRLWGRLIGVAFAVPLFYFAVRGHLSNRRWFSLCVLFCLGGAQGVLGWYMVKSGLVNDPEVSQYRLMAHLGFAFALYSALIWVGLSFYCGRQPTRPKNRVLFLWGLSYITILAGALVAGLDAGLTYNTFPLMDGDWVPDGLYSHSPFYLNHFENITLVQFQHRVLAITTVLATFAILWNLRNESCAQLCLLLVVIQAGLGILTLIYVVPIALASLHQACGLLLFTAITWLNFKIRK
ncbi:MAG: COX15/CtaA family protein [Methylocystaceae bacterium]|nr:COX15/CtaA family protein [Methylocystaceae bacterium]